MSHKSLPYGAYIILLVLSLENPIFADQVSDGLTQASAYIAGTLGLSIAAIGGAWGGLICGTGKMKEGLEIVKNSLIGAAIVATITYLVPLVYGWFS